MKSKFSRNDVPIIEEFLKTKKMDLGDYSPSFERLIRQCYGANTSFRLIEWFAKALNSYKQNKSDKNIDLSTFKPLKKGQCKVLKDIKYPLTNKQQSLKKLAVIKLNGGLGTSMGCDGPKALISITKTKRFIDIIEDQHAALNKKAGMTIPLLMMNSFYTHSDMKAHKASLIYFLQHRIPRVIASNLNPLNTNTMADWAPPGHGNIYLSLYESGLLDHLIEEGKEVAFISNSDNLGATVNDELCNYFISKELDFLMEVTPRTELDKKGGSIGYYNKQLSLLERVQVSKNQLHNFEDMNHFHYFNTNTIWVRLQAIKQAIDSNQLELPILINKKTIAKNDIIQFETAMGSAIRCFKNSECVHVERNRFFPVKKTSDLWLLQSNLVIKNKDGTLHWNTKNKLPSIQLSHHYECIKTYQSLVNVVPDITQLTSLTVNGPIIFEENITLIGDVVINNNSNKPKVLNNIKIKDQDVTI
tara:strand:+ start:526 stop:1944 length:1419 start_codon:yes stop_codon:yes gene_type:complete